eukprot:6491453-Amphidinium_carterae.2
MASVGDLIVQITNTSAFLSSQHEVGLDKAVIDETMVAMSESLSMQVACMPDFTMEAAARLNTALAASAFTREQTSKVAKAIAAKTVASATTVNKGTLSTQTLLGVAFYFTHADIQALQDGRNTQLQRVQTVSQRCSKLGLTSPSEATIKHLAAFIGCFAWPNSVPTADEAYSLVLDLKNGIGANKGQSKLFHLPHYPSTPDMLSADIYATAYPEHDKPYPVVLERFNLMLTKIVCRSSNKSLCLHKHPPSAVVPVQQTPQPAEFVAQALMALGIQPQGCPKMPGLLPPDGSMLSTPPPSQQYHSPPSWISGGSVAGHVPKTRL